MSARIVLQLAAASIGARGPRPPIKPPRLPKLCFDSRGYPRVCLSGTWVRLGKPDAPDLHLRYRQLLARWLANGRRYPFPEDQPSAIDNVRQLGELYLQHCRAYYTKRGKPTTTVGNVEVTLKILKRARMDTLHVGAMTPRRLKKLQRMMLRAKGSPWGAQTINRYVGIVVKMYRWGASEGLVPPEQWQALTAVEKLRRGRAPGPGLPAPRGRRAIQAVPLEQLQATLKHLAPMHRAMVELQLAAAMRPMEVCAMRGRDLYRTADPDVIAYVPDPALGDKLEHLRGDDGDVGRVVYIGPRGRAIIDQWLPEDPDQHVFRPFAAERELLEARRRRRLDRDGRPVEPRRQYQDHYEVGSYRQIVARACARACDELGLEGDARWCWSPRQLRHNGATSMMELEGIEIASRLLGHSQIRTTTIYAKVRDQVAIAAAKRVS